MLLKEVLKAVNNLQDNAQTLQSTALPLKIIFTVVQCSLNYARHIRSCISDHGLAFTNVTLSLPLDSDERFVRGEVSGNF